MGCSGTSRREELAVPTLGCKMELKAGLGEFVVLREEPS